MSTIELPFHSRRSAVYGVRGMVATSQPEAVAAGVDALRRGGNAADAAVCAAAVLAVTEPCSNGVGGDCFALYYEAATGRISALNGSGRAAAAADLARARAGGFTVALPPFHGMTVTVPGAVAAWADLLERHGTLSLADAVAPAIRLAADGFCVAPITAHFWARGASVQLARAEHGGELLVDGRAPAAGERFRNPNLAAVLERVARHGVSGFYAGETASAIVAAVSAAGGVLSMDDLAAHRSTWDEPIGIDYGPITVHECPPNGQGLAALIALGILARVDRDAFAAARTHHVIEALRLAFADARRYIADPACVEVPVEQLLDPAYLEARAALIDPARATADPEAGRPLAASDTVYLSCVDAAGNACSFIQSNYMGFGTGIVPRGTGFSLHNRGHNFSLDVEHPNAMRPGKRPYHTIIPALATRRDGSLYASFGVMGGFMQPQGHVQVVLALVDDDLDPQAALDRWRVCLDPHAHNISVEDGIPDEVVQKLANAGHDLRVVTGYDRAVFGRGQIITRDRDTGVLCGGSDPRADGCAFGA